MGSDCYRVKNRSPETRPFYRSQFRTPTGIPCCACFFWKRVHLPCHSEVYMTDYAQIKCLVGRRHFTNASSSAPSLQIVCSFPSSKNSVILQVTGCKLQKVIAAASSQRGRDLQGGCAQLTVPCAALLVGGRKVGRSSMQRLSKARVTGCPVSLGQS